MSELKSRPTHNEPAAPVSLADLVQLAELGARSERVRVRRGSTEGILFIDRGAVVHAFFGNLSGEAAAQAIFKQADQPATRLAFEEPDVRSMELRPSQLLLIFAVEADELTRHEAPQARRPNEEGGDAAPHEASAPGTGNNARTGFTSHGTGSSPSATGSGKTGIRTGTGSFKSQTGSTKTPGGSSKSGRRQAQRSDGWLWRAIALCFLAGGVSYSYFRYFAPKPIPPAVAIEMPVVDADTLTGLTDVVPRLVEAPVPRRPSQEVALQPTIVVRALVGGDGSVTQASVVDPRSAVAAFETAAVDAVKRYRFKPAQRAGQVVAAWMTIPVRFASGDGHAAVLVRGSVGLSPLVEAVGKAFEESGAAAVVKGDMDGAAPCLTSLFEYEASLCINSRPIRTEELEDAKAVGVEIQEHVLGWTHAAVVVHPLNPILELTLPQLSQLFGGKDQNWKALAGEDWPVSLLGTPRDSAPSDAFRDSVLKQAEFPGKVVEVSDSKELFATVAKTPGAIAFASTQEVAAELLKANDYIKPVAISEAQKAATKATPESLAKRAYPIHTQLSVYSRAALDQHTHQLLSLLFSKAGRVLALQNDISPGPQVLLPPFAASEVRVPKVYHVKFSVGSVGLDIAARLRLDQVALQLVQSEKRWAVVFGHADPVTEPSESEALAEKRVEAVERYLTSGGLAQGRVERRMRGVSRPRSGKPGAESQAENRRVEVFVVERP